MAKMKFEGSKFDIEKKGVKEGSKEDMRSDRMGRAKMKKALAKKKK